MKMHVVFINGDQTAPSAKKVSKQQARVSNWIARQYQRGYDEAIKENLEDILRIQKSIPGWMPKKETIPYL